MQETVWNGGILRKNGVILVKNIKCSSGIDRYQQNKRCLILADLNWNSVEFTGMTNKDRKRNIMNEKIKMAKLKIMN